MTNTMLDLIKSRRSCRSYLDTAVPEEKLDAVLEAGTYAPTGGGRQSPVIVAVKDAETREQLIQMNAKIMGKADANPYYGAPVILLVLADGNANTAVEDGSCVLENMMLAAHSEGLSSVWVHREYEMFQSEEGKALLRKWGLSEQLRGVGSLALGYAAVEPADPPARKNGYIVKV